MIETYKILTGKYDMVAVPNLSKVNTDIAVSNQNYHTATGNRMPYRITQCYLSPGSSDFPAFTPAKAGT